MKRYGSIIKVKPESLDEYKRVHREVWPGVLKTIWDCNMRNYSIFYGNGCLFSYFEYIGDNYEADMKKMEADPVTLEWWKITKPMQEPLENVPEGGWWLELEEVFHVD